MINKIAKKAIKDPIRRFLRTLNISIEKYNEFIELKNRLAKTSEKANFLDFLLAMPQTNLSNILKFKEVSKSQLLQDLFVLSELNFKENGFFVEFGATDGMEYSNTYLLENNFHWNGILAEPARSWHKALKENRKCQIDFDCVWTKTGMQLEFNETEALTLSTINAFSTSDNHRDDRNNKKNSLYHVNTISLEDLLKKHNAPYDIDYLSIDTEGSEYEILQSFDFDKYNIRIITCEHNFTDMRDKIFDLLTSKGYTRKYTQLSQFDDWYVKQ